MARASDQNRVQNGFNGLRDRMKSLTDARMILIYECCPQFCSKKSARGRQPEGKRASYNPNKQQNKNRKPNTMKSNFIIETAAVAFLSLSLGTDARVEIAGVDPENYVPKEVSADVAKGGIQKLHDLGFLKFENESRVKQERKGNLRAL